MTKQVDIMSDERYIPVHNHGFVGLIDTMGSDADIVSAARVSYGSGTKTINQDRGLIRYLLRHRHTSPIEMCEVKLHLKMPIFVMRQWVRHRTASLNEESARYSVISDEMYLPEPDLIQPQSKDNKQGRAGELSDKDKLGVRWFIDAGSNHSYSTYEALLKGHDDYESDRERRDALYDPYEEDDGLLSEEYPGIARELARVVLPLATYTELYWKQDLHNMLHLLKLRRDAHAQREIRDYADAVFDLIKPHFPLVIEAWEDYVWNGVHMSRMDAELMKDILASQITASPSTKIDALILGAGSEQKFCEQRGYSLREFREFRKQWSI
jgi:thymidylate synthase (FAD)